MSRQNWWAESIERFRDMLGDIADFGESDCAERHQTPADAQIVEGPFQVKISRRAADKKWWADHWLRAIETAHDSQRLTKGRTYARNGSVLWLEINYGQVFAQVQGSSFEPYCVTLHIRQLSDSNWKSLLDTLGSQASYGAKLLVGEMPQEVEALLNTNRATLFPTSQRSLTSDCTCLDYEPFCKHAAAVCYVVSELIEADPFVLLHLLGRTRDQVLAALGLTIPAASPAAAADPEDTWTEVNHFTTHLTVADFWQAPTNYKPLPAPIKPKTPPVIAQHGPPPDGSRDLEKLYKLVSKAARSMLPK